MSNKFVLHIEDLTVSFDGFKAVDGLNFYLEPDALHCVVGPNGAGKTTLLDMICGKTKPTSGKIYFKDTDITELMEYQITRLGIGRKFQTPSVYDQLTVFENLEISHPNPRGVLGSVFFKRTDRITQKVYEVAHKIFLGDHLDDTAAILSHGQKQWLEIGMLMMQDPELILLDEPVAGMSAKEREKTAALLNEISPGRSIIVIEHDMAFVKMVAKKVTVLHQGKLLAEGTLEKVQENEQVKQVYLGH